MKTCILGVLMLLFACGSASAQQKCPNKLQEYINGSGHQVIEATPCKIWFMPGLFEIPKGEGLQGLLLIGQEDDLVVLGTVVQTKAKDTLSREMLVKLLQLNNDVDYAKTGIDKDGDLFVRTEMRISALTAEDFKNAIRYVVNAGNRAYGLLK